MVEEFLMTLMNKAKMEGKSLHYQTAWSDVNNLIKGGYAPTLSLGDVRVVNVCDSWDFLVVGFVRDENVVLEIKEKQQHIYISKTFESFGIKSGNLDPTTLSTFIKVVSELESKRPS